MSNNGEPGCEVPAPSGVGIYSERASYVTIEQAAFIMQESVETLMDFIRGGLLLCHKGSLDNDGPVMIHQSELDRFKRPWKHVWRLDDRINGLQGRLEALIKKTEGSRGMDDILSQTQLRVSILEESVEEMELVDKSLKQIDIESMSEVVSQLCDDVENIKCEVESINRKIGEFSHAASAINKLLSRRKR